VKPQTPGVLGTYSTSTGTAFALLLVVNNVNYNCVSCLYGCESWSVTLREEHRRRVKVKKMLREKCKGKLGKLFNANPKQCY
jgi:hypothetical protein